MKTILGTSRGIGAYEPHICRGTWGSMRLADLNGTNLSLANDTCYWWICKRPVTKLRMFVHKAAGKNLDVFDGNGELKAQTNMWLHASLGSWCTVCIECANLGVSNVNLQMLTFWWTLLFWLILSQHTQHVTNTAMQTIWRWLLTMTSKLILCTIWMCALFCEF